MYIYICICSYAMLPHSPNVLPCFERCFKRVAPCCSDRRHNGPLVPEELNLCSQAVTELHLLAGDTIFNTTSKVQGLLGNFMGILWGF